MSRFPVGAKVKGILQSCEIKVGEVVSEDDEYLWVYDQFGQGPFPWHKKSVQVEEINECNTTS